MIEIFFVIIALFFCWFCYKFHRLQKLVSHIPGDPLWPIVGNGLDYVGKSPEDITLKTLELSAKYGSIFRVFLGPQLVIALSDPKDVEVVLSSQALIEKADEYDYMAEWLGTGLLISTGQKWFTRRKAITPAFHFQILEQFVEVFDKHSAILVKILKCKDQEFDIFNYVTLCALDVICETSMGVEIHAQINSESEYVKAVQEVSGIITTRHYNLFLRSNLIFRFSPLYCKQKKYLKTLHGFTDNVILARREELTKSLENGTKPNVDDVGAKRKMALLDVLLQSTINGQPLTNIDIREEVDTFMFEGHDTTTSGIAFALYNLAKHPSVQTTAFNEIMNVIGADTEAPVTLRDLNHMNYLELVIKETLRLYPSVPLYGRKNRKDFLLNGKLIPKGATIGIAALCMGRDPLLFENPNSFIPERFLSENVNQNNFAYVPFSAGPRNCIGQKFAMLEMKSVISKLLRNFEIHLGENFEPTLVAEIILRSSNGIRVRLTPRIYK